MKSQAYKILKKVRINQRAHRWKFLARNGQLQNKNSSPKVLIWRGPGKITSSLNIELLIAGALRERGLEPVFLLCDGRYNHACNIRTYSENDNPKQWNSTCDLCLYNIRKHLDVADFDYYDIKNLIGEKVGKELRDLAQNIPDKEMPNYEFQGVLVGQYALSSTVRYFKGLEKSQEDAFYLAVFREFLTAAIINTAAAQAALEQFSPSYIFLQHGIYSDWGPFYDVMLRDGLRVTRWARSPHLKDCLILRNDNADDKYFIFHPPNDDATKVLEQPLSPKQEKELDDFIENYSFGKARRIKMASKMPDEKLNLRKKLGITNDYPIWVLFSHISWDSQFSKERAMLYPNTNIWAIETLRLMIPITNVNWIVKIHPAEKTLGTMQGVYGNIKENFDNLPDHIHILQPETDINTYAMLPEIDGGFTISGTIGIELALNGKPVVMGGEAYFGNRGFTIQPPDIDSYQKCLQNITSISPLTPYQVSLCRRFAHYFFIQRRIPFDLVTKDGASPQINNIKPLQEGGHRIVDFIVNKILNGGDFSLERQS